MSDSYGSDSFASKSASRPGSASRRSSPSSSPRRSPRPLSRHPSHGGDTSAHTPTSRRIVDEEDDHRYPRAEDDAGDMDEPSQVVVSGVPISFNPDGSTTRVLSAGQFRQLFQQSIAKSHFHTPQEGAAQQSNSTPPRARQQGNNQVHLAHPRPPSASSHRSSKAATRLRGVTKSNRPVHGTGRAVSTGSGDRAFIDPYRCTKFRNVIHAPLPNSAASKPRYSAKPEFDSNTSIIAHAAATSHNTITSRREDMAEERAETLRKELTQTKHELARREKQIETLKVKSQQTTENLSKVEAVMTRGRPQSEADALVHSMESLRGRNAIQAKQIAELEEQVYQLKLNTRASKVGELQTQCGMYISEIQRLQLALQTVNPSPAGSNGGSTPSKGKREGVVNGSSVMGSQRDAHVGALQEKVQSLREDVRLAESEASKWKSLYNAEKPKIAEAQRRMNELKSAPTEIYRLKTELETTSARLRDTQNQLSAHLEAKSMEQSGIRGTVEQLVAERDRLSQQLKDNEAVAAQQRKNIASREREMDAEAANRSRAAVDQERALGADREKVLREQIIDLKAQVETLEELNQRQKANHESDIAKLKLMEQQRQENLLSTVNKHEKQREEELIRGTDDRERELQRQVVKLQEEKREWDTEAQALQRRLEEERAAHNATKQKLQRMEQQLRLGGIGGSVKGNETTTAGVGGGPISSFTAPAPTAPPPPTPMYRQSANPVAVAPAYEAPTFVNDEPPAAVPHASPDNLSDSSLRRGEMDPKAATQVPPSSEPGSTTKEAPPLTPTTDVKATRYHRQDDLMSEVTVQIRRPQAHLPEESEVGRNSPGSVQLENSMMPLSGVYEAADAKALNTSEQLQFSTSSRDSGAAKTSNKNATSAEPTAIIAPYPEAPKKPMLEPVVSSGSGGSGSALTSPVEVRIPPKVPPIAIGSSISPGVTPPPPPPAAEDDELDLPRPNPIAGIVSLDDKSSAGGTLDFGGSTTVGDIVTEGTQSQGNAAPLNFEVDSDSSGEF